MTHNHKSTFKIRGIQLSAVILEAMIFGDCGLPQHILFSLRQQSL